MQIYEFGLVGSSVTQDDEKMQRFYIISTQSVILSTSGYCDAEEEATARYIELDMLAVESMPFICNVPTHSIDSKTPTAKQDVRLCREQGDRGGLLMVEAVILGGDCAL